MNYKTLLKLKNNPHRKLSKKHLAELKAYKHNTKVKKHSTKLPKEK